MKFAILFSVCAISLSVWACGGGEKPPLTPENDLVDSDSGVEAPGAASAFPAPSVTVPTVAPAVSAPKK